MPYIPVIARFQEAHRIFAKNPLKFRLCNRYHNATENGPKLLVGVGPRCYFFINLLAVGGREPKTNRRH
jgi:hypothetical protein